MIDAYGRSDPKLRLGPGVQGVIDAPLPPALAPTLYARFGEAIFGLMLGLSLTAILTRLGPSARDRLHI